MFFIYGAGGALTPRSLLALLAGGKGKKAREEKENSSLPDGDEFAPTEGGSEIERGEKPFAINEVISIFSNSSTQLELI